MRKSEIFHSVSVLRREERNFGTITSVFIFPFTMGALCFLRFPDFMFCVVLCFVNRG